MKRGKSVERGVPRNEGGAVFVLFAMFLSGVALVAALVVDYGDVLQEAQRIQFASDMGALAGTRMFKEQYEEAGKIEDVSSLEALEVARRIALRNGLTEAEMSNGSDIQLWRRVPSGPDEYLGNYNGISAMTADQVDDVDDQVMAQDFEPSSTGESVTVQPYVVIESERSVPSVFGRLAGVTEMSPTRLAAASLDVSRTREVQTITATLCLRPFGIESASLTELGEIDWGTTEIEVGNNSPANWGKLDIGGNMSSGNNFEEAMLNGACNLNPAPYSGQMISPGTGFGGPIRDIFQALGDSTDPVDQRWLIAKVDEFPNGNSGMVELLSFLEVELVEYSLGSGMHWTAKLRLVAEHLSSDDVETTVEDSVVSTDVMNGKLIQ